MANADYMFHDGNSENVSALDESCGGFTWVVLTMSFCAWCVIIVFQLALQGLLCFDQSDHRPLTDDFLGRPTGARPRKDKRCCARVKDLKSPLPLDPLLTPEEEWESGPGGGDPAGESRPELRKYYRKKAAQLRKLRSVTTAAGLYVPSVRPPLINIELVFSFPPRTKIEEAEGTLTEQEEDFRDHLEELEISPIKVDFLSDLANAETMRQFEKKYKRHRKEVVAVIILQNFAELFAFHEQYYKQDSRYSDKISAPGVTVKAEWSEKENYCSIFFKVVFLLPFALNLFLFPFVVYLYPACSSTYRDYLHDDVGPYEQNTFPKASCVFPLIAFVVWHVLTGKVSRFQFWETSFLNSTALENQKFYNDLTTMYEYVADYRSLATFANIWMFCVTLGSLFHTTFYEVEESDMPNAMKRRIVYQETTRLFSHITSFCVMTVLILHVFLYERIIFTIINEWKTVILGSEDSDSGAPTPAVTTRELKEIELQCLDTSRSRGTSLRLKEKLTPEQETEKREKIVKAAANNTKSFIRKTFWLLKGILIMLTVLQFVVAFESEAKNGFRNNSSLAWIAFNGLALLVYVTYITIHASFLSLINGWQDGKYFKQKAKLYIYAVIGCICVILFLSEIFIWLIESMIVGITVTAVWLLILGYFGVLQTNSIRALFSELDEKSMELIVWEILEMYYIINAETKERLKESVEKTHIAANRMYQLMYNEEMEWNLKNISETMGKTLDTVNSYRVLSETLETKNKKWQDFVKENPHFNEVLTKVLDSGYALEGMRAKLQIWNEQFQRVLEKFGDPDAWDEIKDFDLKTLKDLLSNEAATLRASLQGIPDFMDGKVSFEVMQQRLAVQLVRSIDLVQLLILFNEEFNLLPEEESAFIKKLPIADARSALIWFVRAGNRKPMAAAEVLEGEEELLKRCLALLVEQLSREAGRRVPEAQRKELEALAAVATITLACSDLKQWIVKAKAHIPKGELEKVEQIERFVVFMLKSAETRSRAKEALASVLLGGEKEALKDVAEGGDSLHIFEKDSEQILESLD